MLIRTTGFELEMQCAPWLRAGSLYVKLGKRDWWIEWGQAMGNRQAA